MHHCGILLHCICWGCYKWPRPHLSMISNQQLLSLTCIPAEKEASQPRGSSQVDASLIQDQSHAFLQSSAAWIALNKSLLWANQLIVYVFGVPWNTLLSPVTFQWQVVTALWHFLEGLWDHELEFYRYISCCDTYMKTTQCPLQNGIIESVYRALILGLLTQQPIDVLHQSTMYILCISVTLLHWRMIDDWNKTWMEIAVPGTELPAFNLWHSLQFSTQKVKWDKEDRTMLWISRTKMYG